MCIAFFYYHFGKEFDICGDIYLFRLPKDVNCLITSMFASCWWEKREFPIIIILRFFFWFCNCYFLLWFIHQRFHSRFVSSSCFFLFGDDSKDSFLCFFFLNVQHQIWSCGGWHMNMRWEYEWIICRKTNIFACQASEMAADAKVRMKNKISHILARASLNSYVLSMRYGKQKMIRKLSNFRQRVQ